MPIGSFASLQTFERLGVALALGLLIGLERGWERRDRAEGSRSAGFRTFGVIGLLGGIAEHLGRPWLVTALVIALMPIAAAGYWRDSQDGEDVSITTAVCTLLTLCLGAMAGAGELLTASSTAVVVALLLGFKPELHLMLRRLDRAELQATLRLLLISVVLLPVLPNRGFGPWSALNPYRLWWMVVLVAALSYVGYFANRFFGERRGVLMTGLFGGLVSATALTLDLSRRGEANEDEIDLLAAAIAIGGAAMLPRMLVIIAAIDQAVTDKVAWPLAAGTVASLIAAAWFAFRGRRVPHTSVVHQHPQLGNPFEIWTALEFGAILAVIMVVSQAAVAWIGQNGLYFAAALSGLVNVDAISLTVATMAAQGRAGVDTAVKAVLAAALVNILVRPFMSAATAGAGLAWRVTIVVLATTIAGAVAFFAMA
jgi:uncharacterized membrane protein (DUF4010 family)